MEVYEIVKKLVGEIKPIGEINTDNERFENLKTMVGLVDRLIADIDEVIQYKDKVEFSMRRAGIFADKFLDRLGISE